VHSTALPPLRCNQLNNLRAFYQATEATSGVDVSILFPDLKGNPLPFDGGVYSNKANVLHGHLKTLYARVLERQAKPVRSLREIMNGSDAPEVRP
jgi:hypothetical protein